MQVCRPGLQFRTEEDPSKLDDSAVYTKVEFLQQLSTWTLKNPDLIQRSLSATEGERTMSGLDRAIRSADCTGGTSHLDGLVACVASAQGRR